MKAWSGDGERPFILTCWAMETGRLLLRQVTTWSTVDLKEGDVDVDVWLREFSQKTKIQKIWLAAQFTRSVHGFWRNYLPFLPLLFSKDGLSLKSELYIHSKGSRILGPGSHSCQGDLEPWPCSASLSLGKGSTLVGHATNPRGFQAHAWRACSEGWCGSPASRDQTFSGVFLDYWEGASLEK